MIPAWLNLQALAVAGAAVGGGLLLNSYQNAVDFRTRTIAAVEQALDVRGLSRKQALAGIAELGESRQALLTAVATSARLRGEAARSREASEGARVVYRSTGDRLVAVSRTDKDYKQACEASEAVKEQWR